MAKAVASGQRGEIHVGYAPSLTVELLPCDRDRFNKRIQACASSFTTFPRRKCLRGLRNGRLHVALMVQVTAKVMADLVFEEFAVMPSVSPCIRRTSLARARKVA